MLSCRFFKNVTSLLNKFREAAYLSSSKHEERRSGDVCILRALVCVSAGAAMVVCCDCL